MGKFHKKGFSQIDWAVSLAVFLIYLAWFFMFAKPQVVNNAVLSPILNELEKNIEDKLQGSVTKTPIFVLSSANYSGPIFLGLKEADDRYYIKGPNSYIVDDNELVIVDFFSNDTKIYERISSDNAYNFTTLMSDLVIIDNITTTSKNFSVRTSQGSFEELLYNDKYRVYDITMTLNEQPIDISNNSFENKNALAEFRINSQAIDVFSKIYSLSSFARVIVKKKDKFNQYILDLSFNIYGFKGFYGDGENHFDFGNETVCKEYVDDYLRFFDDKKSLVIESKNTLNITVCGNTNHSTIELKKILGSNEDLKFHFLDNGNGENPSFNLKEGISYNLTGFSEEAITELNYSQFKKDINFALDKEFYVVFYDAPKNNLSARVQNNLLNSIGPEPGYVYELKSKEIEKTIVDGYGNVRPLTIIIGVW